MSTNPGASASSFNRRSARNHRLVPIFPASGQPDTRGLEELQGRPSSVSVTLYDCIDSPSIVGAL
jgi:hypothetical protein